jgi:hypothetical protein
MIDRLILGIFAGATFAILGFGKHRKEEKFNYEKFITTVVVGAFAGMISVFIEIQMNYFYWYVLDIGIVAVIEYGLKTIKRRLWPELFR